MRTNTFTINITRKLSTALLLFFTLLLYQARGQQVPIYYSFTSSSGTFTPAPGLVTLGIPTQDDDSYYGLDLGFSFNYNGTTFTQISVNANGFITLGGSITSEVNVISNRNTTNNYAIAAFNRDIQGSPTASLTYDTVGTAPYRTCIVQWMHYKKYGSGGAGDDFDFQILLHESTNIIEIVYGNATINTNAASVQVGLVGNANISTDYNSRTSSTDWTSTTASINRNDAITLSSTVYPPSGLTYRWTPAPLAYNTSIVSNVTSNSTSPGSTLQGIVKLKVTVDGYVNYLPLTSMNVSTAGTTSLADISNLSVYYTGNSGSFSSAQQVGTTVATPSSNNLITDSVNLVYGDNYFWVTYDISPSATLGNVVDAAITSLTVGNTARIPTVTAPAGNRLIEAPMTYINSLAKQTILDRVAQGSVNNPVIGMMVITSHTGAPLPVTQFDLTANGTTDTADVENYRIYYTRNSNVFNTNEQFGSTLAGLPGTMNFSITGTQMLENDTNYFWLTYDVKAGATISHVIDGEFTSVVVSGTPQTPSVTNPPGNREIRQEYCMPVVPYPVNACNNNYFLNDVSTTGAVVNINNMNNGCSLSPTGRYRFDNKPLVVNQTQQITLTVGDLYGQDGYAAWIDYNQDGVFDNITERVLSSPRSDMDTYSATFTIPCEALTGNTTMRVISGDYYIPTDPCYGPYYGEIEEYPVTINALPVGYTSSTAIQQSGLVAPGILNRPILRIPVKTDGCGTGTANQFYFNTAGTTAAADIAVANLYSTGNNPVFNTSKLLGTITSPSGSFSFAVTDTLLNNDTTNYWLVYDISASATLGNFVDARADSISAIAGTYVPSVTSPAGNIQITAAMTYLSSTTVQSSNDRVAQGAANQDILKVMLITSSSGAPAVLSQMDFTANGTTDTADIENLRVYYTGNSSTFSTTTQFGGTLAMLPGTMNFTFTGSQFLANDTNYLWLTYGIRSGATISNVVDGEFTSATIDGTAHVPSVTNPSGNREIRQEYCMPVVPYPVDACNNDYFLNDVSTTGAVVDIDNTNNGCSLSPTGRYRFSNKPLVVKQAQTITLTVGDLYAQDGYAAWIDYNQDGVFDNITEMVLQSPNPMNTYSATFVIPCEALAGNTLMRVISGDYYVPSDPCYGPYFGEIEEYPVTILPAPVVYTSSTAIQQPGAVAPGTINKPILRIPVRADGCGDGVVTELFFNTAGSTAAVDIAAAKLYVTGASTVFSPANLLGTVSAPSGAFSFSVSDTLVNNDTTNYWLVYDISASATLSNVVDARADSITAVGITYIPTVTNPAGNSQITVPMTYLSSTTVQANVDRIAQGSQKGTILKAMLITSSTGAPITLSQMDFTANGTTDTADIENLRVYYTGNSSTFSTTTQFGGTLAMLPGTMNFSFTGSQFLVNDTNYLWLTYGIRGGATIGNVVDGEFTSAMIGGATETPAVTSPAGNREIRQEYCLPVVPYPANACNNGYFLNDVSTTGAVVNINNTNNGCSRSSNGNTRFDNNPLVVNQAQTVTLTVGDIYGQDGYAAWIDYNQDGVFDNITERVLQSSSGNMVSYSGSFTVPCGALLGNTMMRVISGDYYVPSDPCYGPYYGEVEEYPVTILYAPVSYTGSTAIQQLGAVSAGTMDKPILRIPVRVDGCGTGTATELYFNTTGTTAVSDIAAAKLYSTGNSSSFSTARLLGTVIAPAGAFSFSVTDTLLNNDTTNYWLAYDISPSAVLNNFVDAGIDSIIAVGAGHIPTVTAPAGNSQILTPMTFISATTTQFGTSSVGQGTAGNNIIGIEVVTSATGAPVPMTSIDIATTGTTSLIDISNLKVWYTGTSSSFDQVTQFGATVGTPAATQTVGGFVSLTNGTNYFWVTYDVSPFATIGNVVDAECTSLTVAGSPEIPAVTAPAGSRMIRADYCVPTQPGSPNLKNVTFNTLNNTSPPAVSPFYTMFPQSGTMTTSVNRGGTYNLSVTIEGGGNAIGSVWIDFNDDGVLSASEWTQISVSIPSNSTFTVPVSIPVTATLGSLRMRVRTRAEGNSNGATDACTGFGSGEAEDYTITILPEPSPSTYVWNNSAGGDFTVAANWTPNRNILFLSDKLVFNLGGTVNVSNLTAQTIRALEVTNATRVNIGAAATGVFSVKDSLTMDAGSKIYSASNITLTIGTDTNNVGGIYTAAGSGINGVLRRWKNTALTTLAFPLIDAAGITKAVSMTYSISPTASGSITSTFRTAGVNNTGLPLTDGGITATKAAPEGYWSLTATNGLSGGQYDVSCNATGFGFITNYVQTIAVYRSGNFSPWSLSGTYAATTGSNTAPVINRTGMTVYGQFALAADSSINPLPVELLKFTAVNNKGNVSTSWTTASEINNKGFEVQASVNGQSFEPVGFVKGSGNSATALDYSFVQEKAFAAFNTTVLYYRLKQVDNDGRYSYSNIVKVTSSGMTQAVSAYPNPFNDKVSLTVNMPAPAAMKVTVLDLQGRMVMNESVTLVKGNNDVVLNLAHLSTGAYLVRTEMNGESNTFKLIKSE